MIFQSKVTEEGEEEEEEKEKQQKEEAKEQEEEQKEEAAGKEETLSKPQGLGTRRNMESLPPHLDNSGSPSVPTVQHGRNSQDRLALTS